MRCAIRKILFRLSAPRSSLPRPLPANQFWICNKRTIDFDSITVLNQAMVGNALTPNAELSAIKIDLRMCLQNP